MLKNILVAVDGSDPANKGLELAADFAAKYQARITVLHAWQDAPLPQPLFPLAEEAGIAHIHHATAAVGHNPQPDSQPVTHSVGDVILRHCQETLSELGAPDVDTILEEGDPVKVVLAAASRLKADLIVLGSRGLSPLKGLLLGSVSHQVAQLAPCPTLIVK